MMIRLGHHAKIGSPPTLIGHDISVSQVRPSAVAIPTSPPPQAIHHIHVALSRWPNSKSSIGCGEMHRDVAVGDTPPPAAG